jgi:hypothetical protein
MRITEAPMWVRWVDYTFITLDSDDIDSTDYVSYGLVGRPEIKGSQCNQYVEYYSCSAWL